jgi:hypothetical protein
MILPSIISFLTPFDSAIEDISMMVYLLVYLGWLFSISYLLNNEVPKDMNLNITILKFLILIPTLYASVFVTFLNVLDDNPSSFTMVLHISSMVIIFYSMLFSAKTINSIELKRKVTFSDYAGDFMLFWFFPIGIWIIQPRVNKLFKKYK